jgi:hypothetical protein
MLEIISLGIIIVLVFLAGDAFRKQYKQNNLTSCLGMLVVMTMSTTMGILIAHWLSDIVIATIISIIGSLILSFILMYKLPLKILIENGSTLFMGAMMGVMFELMTTKFYTLSLLFFMTLFIGSVIVAIGFWNRFEYPEFRKAVPLNVIIFSGLSIFTIGLFSVLTIDFHQVDEEKRMDAIHQHHQ